MTESHLNALEVRLRDEKERESLEPEGGAKELRKVWIKGIEKEISAEKEFLGITEVEMTDEELLAALGS